MAYSLTVLELLAVVLATAIAFLAPERLARWLAPAERALGRFAAHRALAVLAIALLPLVARAALLPLIGLRAPATLDEFAHLLAADTFAHGRLTNPTHPMWVFFETPHVIQQPTYASMYPPAQGAVMAAGSVLFGTPMAGVWISVGLMCAAVTWMLYVWLPPRWAVVGGLLFALRLGVFSYWMNSYWGGAIPALGGALVLGAAPRLWRAARPRVRDALLLALGLTLLATSRPFEGLVASLPVGVMLLAWLWRWVRGGGAGARAAIGRVVVPAAVVLALTGAALARYNARVTGSPTTMPQQVSWVTYRTAGQFIWQDVRPEPAYHDAKMRDFYRWERNAHLSARSPAGLVTRWLGHARTIILFYLGPALLVPLVMLPWVTRDRRIRLALVAVALTALAVAQEVWLYPHYVAPVAAAIFVVVLQCLRHLRTVRWRGRPVGLALARAIPAVALFTVVARVPAQPLFRDDQPEEWPTTWYCTTRGALRMARIEAELEATPGRDLVLVRYAPDHSVHSEWVHNHADIDGAEVVWARDRGPAANDSLIGYFRDRRVWLVEPDRKPVRPEPLLPGRVSVPRPAHAGAQ